MDFHLGRKAGGLPLPWYMGKLCQTVDLRSSGVHTQVSVVHLGNSDSLPNLGLAEAIEAELGIQTIVVDGSFPRHCLDSMRWLGELFGCQGTGSGTALYAENTLMKLEILRNETKETPAAVLPLVESDSTKNRSRHTTVAGLK